MSSDLGYARWNEDSRVFKICRDLLVSGIRDPGDMIALIERTLPTFVDTEKKKRNLKRIFSEMRLFYGIEDNSCSNCNCSRKAISLFCPRCDKKGVKVFYCSLVCAVGHEDLHQSVCGK